MGDIYMKLQKFYEKYDIFYKNVDGQYLQNGLTYADAEAKDGGMRPLTGRKYVKSDWSTGEQVDTVVQNNKLYKIFFYVTKKLI